MRIYEKDGEVMVDDEAGGTGGGVTSTATRKATDAETLAWHDQNVAQTKAAAEAAEKAHEKVVEARKPVEPGPVATA